FTAPARVDGLLFTPDGKALLTGDDKGQVTLREAPTGEVLRSFDGKNQVAAVSTFTADGGTLLLKEQQGDGWAVWDVARASRSYQVGGFGGAVSGDGLVLARPTGKGVSLLDVPSGKELKRLEQDDDTQGPVALAADARTVALAGQGKVYLWDVPTRQLRTL